MVGRTLRLGVLVLGACAPLACGDPEADGLRQRPGAFGRATDVEGKPMEGVTVGMILRSDNGVFQVDVPSEGTPTTRSATTGEWRLPHHDELGWVTAHAAGFCRSAVLADPAGVPIDLPMLKESGRLVGRLVDPRGNGVAGATLVAEVRRERYAWWTSGTSLEDGSFDVSLPDHASDWGGLSVRHPDFHALHSALPMLDEQGVGRLTLRLRPLEVVSGLVLDADTGDPVPGARVSWSGSVANATQSDEDGRFELRMRQDHQWQVSVDAGGYALAAADPVPMAAGRAEVTFRLKRGHRPLPPTPTKQARVSGFVVDSSGRPVAYARVGLNRSYGWPQTFHERAWQVADERGRFSATAWVGGTRTIWAHRIGECAAGMALVELDEAAPVDGIRLVVPEGVTLRGRCVTGREEPVAGAVVVATCADRPGASWAVTDAEGWFTLRGLPESEVFLVVRHPQVALVSRRVLATVGELPSPLRFDLRPPLPERPVLGRAIRFVGAVPPDGTSLQVRGSNPSGGSTGATLAVFGGRTRLPNTYAESWTFAGRGCYAGPVEIAGGMDAPEAVVELSRGLLLRGIVRTSSGQPVAGASVVMPPGVSWGGEGDGFGRHVHTDAQGRFDIPGVEPGEEITLEAYATGFGRTSVKTERNNASLEITLVREGGASGIVVPPEGELLPPDWRLAAVLADGSAHAWPRVGDAGGQFSCQSMRPGTWLLRVVTQDGAEGPPTTIRVEEGETVEGILVTAPRRGRVIAGRVRDDEGRSIRGVTVLLFPAGASGEPLRKTRTGIKGTFEFRGLSARLHDLRIDPGPIGPLGRAARVDLAVGTQDIDVVLPQRGSMLGTLVGDPARALGFCTVHLVPDGDVVTWHDLMNRRAPADGRGHDGRFLVDPVDAGRYQLIVVETDAWRGEEHGVGTSEETVVVAPGETVRGIQVTVRRTCSLVISLLDSAGGKAARGELRIQHPQWGALTRSIRPRTPGYVAFLSLPAGDWELSTRLSDAEDWSTPTSVRLDPGQRREMTHRLEER